METNFKGQREPAMVAGSYEFWMLALASKIKYPLHKMNPSQAAHRSETEAAVLFGTL